jgi:hypothetical protein
MSGTRRIDLDRLARAILVLQAADTAAHLAGAGQPPVLGPVEVRCPNRLPADAGPTAGYVVLAGERVTVTCSAQYASQCEVSFPGDTPRVVRGSGPYQVTFDARASGPVDVMVRNGAGSDQATTAPLRVVPEVKLPVVVLPDINVRVFADGALTPPPPPPEAQGPALTLTGAPAPVSLSQFIPPMPRRWR